MRKASPIAFDNFFMEKRRQVAHIFDEDQGRVVRYEIKPGDIIKGYYTTGFITPLDIQAVNLIYDGH